MKIAIIDLGTNTFHLLIAEVEKNGLWEKVLHKRITVKLGQGGIHKNIITEASYRRGINAIRNFRNVIDSYQIKSIHAFGTAALRSSSNGKVFLKELKDDYRISVKVISGDEEALMIHKGVRQAVKMGIERSLIMDIGGGSTEFIIADGKKIYWKQSYKLGASLLHEKFKPSDPIKSGELKLIREYLEFELLTLMNACQKHNPTQIIGSAGSFETFASMIRHRFPDSGSHYGKTEHPILLEHFNKLHRELIVSTSEQRYLMKGLIKMRVDMIVLASILLKFVLDISGIKQVILSAYSLKEGVVASVITPGSRLRST